MTRDEQYRKEAEDRFPITEGLGSGSWTRDMRTVWIEARKASDAELQSVKKQLSLMQSEWQKEKESAGHLSNGYEAEREKVEKLDAELQALREERDNLLTVMVAAAEEIQEHWQAHCDEDGCGPANLMHRLEKGIDAHYPGYTFGAFTKLEGELRQVREAAEAICHMQSQYLEAMYGYKNGSASISEVNLAGEQVNKCFKNLSDLLSQNPQKNNDASFEK